MILIDGDKPDITMFGNGEFKINTFKVKPRMVISFKWESDSEFIQLMHIKRHIDSHNGSAVLFMPYIPYSRMDRRFNDSVFTLKYISEFINYLKFDSVNTIDAHSDVSPALINNCNDVSCVPSLLEDVGCEFDHILYPDSGALKRYKIDNVDAVTATKERSKETGRITKYKVLGNINRLSTVAIVDDLCSYGGTFMHASEQLYAMGARKIILIVAHCEESILKGEIFTDGSRMDCVYTTNSIIDEAKASDKLIIKNIFN